LCHELQRFYVQWIQQSKFLCLKLINLKSNPMNIFGRVFGGFLALISLAWMATIAGIRPGNNSNNQLTSSPTASNLDAPASDVAAPVSNVTTPAQVTSGTTPAATSKAQTSTFSTNNTGVTKTTTTKTTTTVEQNPRDATPPAQSGTSAPAASAPAPVATPPISAGW
jgi:hypothetical protein